MVQSHIDVNDEKRTVYLLVTVPLNQLANATVLLREFLGGDALLAYQLTHISPVSFAAQYIVPLFTQDAKRDIDSWTAILSSIHCRVKTVMAGFVADAIRAGKLAHAMTGKKVDLKYAKALEEEECWE